MRGQASEATTNGVKVRVEPKFVPGRSAPQRGLWFFAYRVTIENVGDEPVRLLSRHWVITDATGEERHVRGPGVIGEQPHLNPGESHRYVSACPMPTSLGAMHGTYQMVTDGGDRFDAEIAPFVLADPLSLN